MNWTTSIGPWLQRRFQTASNSSRRRCDIICGEKSSPTRSLSLQDHNTVHVRVTVPYMLSGGLIEYRLIAACSSDLQNNTTHRHPSTVIRNVMRWMHELEGLVL